MMENAAFSDALVWQTEERASAGHTLAPGATVLAIRLMSYHDAAGNWNFSMSCGVAAVELSEQAAVRLSLGITHHQNIASIKQNNLA